MVTIVLVRSQVPQSEALEKVYQVFEGCRSLRKVDTPS